MPENVQIVCRSKSAQVASGSRKEHIFENGVVYDFANRVDSQHKSFLGLLVRARSYFELRTNRHVLSNLAQTKQLRFKPVLRFHEIRLFEFPKFPDLFFIQD